MAHSILDKLLNNRYPLVNRIIFYGTTVLSAWQTRTWLGNPGALALGLGVGMVNYFFGDTISRKFWGEKKPKVILHIQNNEKIGYVLATYLPSTPPLSNRLFLNYPRKLTLTELESEIRQQLGSILKPSDLLGSEGVAVNERTIEAYTHRISKEMIKKNPNLFYLADLKKVNEPAFQLEIEELMIEPGEKRKLR